jgi:hypothetical protein
MASLETDALKIYNLIDFSLTAGIGCIIGRNGSTELEVILHGKPIEEQHLLNAGIWPEQGFREAALKATLETDLLATGWYKPLEDEEEALLRSEGFEGNSICLRSIEPYYCPPFIRWTKLLMGRRVAIVSPFAKSCISQYRRREMIWPNEASKTLLPDEVHFIPVVTGFPPSISCGRAEWPETIKEWKDAVTHCVEACANAEIVLLGCGGIGMLVAAELKRRGKVCIVMGGALQVLFGIKGRRWITHQTIRGFWNSAWIMPAEEETPRAAGLIEGGCYW